MSGAQSEGWSFEIGISTGKTTYYKLNLQYPPPLHFQPLAQSWLRRCGKQSVFWNIQLFECAISKHILWWYLHDNASFEGSLNDVDISAESKVTVVMKRSWFNCESFACHSCSIAIYANIPKICIIFTSLSLFPLFKTF